jgi:hypothetical protein
MRGFGLTYDAQGAASTCACGRVPEIFARDGAFKRKVG